MLAESDCGDDGKVMQRAFALDEWHIGHGLFDAMPTKQRLLILYKIAIHARIICVLCDETEQRHPP